MPDFEKIQKELRQGTLPESGRNILSYLEDEGESTRTDLTDDLNYTSGTVGRWVSFYEAQDIIEVSRKKESDSGVALEKFYRVLSEYQSE